MYDAAQRGTNIFKNEILWNVIPEVRFEDCFCDFVATLKLESESDGEQDAAQGLERRPCLLTASLGEDL